METNKIFEITININLYILSLYFAFMIAIYVFEKERGVKAQEFFYKFIHLTRSIHKNTKKEMPTYIINNENYSDTKKAFLKIMKIFYEMKNGRIEKKELEPNDLYRITNYIFTFVIESTTSYPFFTEEEINKDIQTDNKEIIKRLDEINEVISFLNILIVENFTILELGLLDLVKIYDKNSKQEFEFRIKSEIDKFSKAYDLCSPDLRLLLKGSRKKQLPLKTLTIIFIVEFFLGIITPSFLIYDLPLNNEHSLPASMIIFILSMLPYSVLIGYFTHTLFTKKRHTTDTPST